MILSSRFYLINEGDSCCLLEIYKLIQFSWHRKSAKNNMNFLISALDFGSVDQDLQWHIIECMKR